MDYPLKRIMSRHIASDDDLVSRIVVYPVALPITWLILNFTSISANAITLTGLALGVTGCLLAAITQEIWVLGWGFCLYFVCDFVDGQVASARGGTQFGALLDHATDHLIRLLALLCLGMHHLLTGESAELFLALCLLGLHNYVDLVLFAKRRATQQHASSGTRPLPPSRQRVRGAQLSAWKMLPSRLSSPLAFIAAYLAFDSFIVALWCDADLDWCRIRYRGYQVCSSSSLPIHYHLGGRRSRSRKRDAAGRVFATSLSGRACCAAHESQQMEPPIYLPSLLTRAILSFYIFHSPVLIHHSSIAPKHPTASKWEASKWGHPSICRAF